MQILWITNIVLPPACEALGLPVPVVGGWMLSSAKSLMVTEQINITVASVYSGKSVKRIHKDGITYILLPSSTNTAIKYNHKLEDMWIKIRDEVNPDVVHIHGTEFTHGLAYIKACGNKNVVISIQGLTSEIYKYYNLGISSREIVSNITFRDCIRLDTIFHQKQKMKWRGRFEKQYIKLSQHIIGRTYWDKSIVTSINPSMDYHVCNETLRDAFYNQQWHYDKCEKLSIFLSQAGYPLKGLHQLLKSMPIVLKHFPSVKVYIAGNNITLNNTLYQKMKISGYGKYIGSLIRKYNLQNNIIFVGSLSEEQMCQQYLSSNLFICTSSIENSPNSLGEAQLLGIPCIASYVGGVPDMMKGAEQNLYRFEEIESLANKIIDVFDDYNQTLLELMRGKARKRHDALNNRQELIKIYKQISNVNF